MDFFQFSVPTKIVFGEGLSCDFSSELDLIPVQKYCVITDKVLVDLKLIDPILEGIRSSGRDIVGVFSEVPSDSGVEVIQKTAAYAKGQGAEGFIAIGGGSVIDTAKGANILFTLGGHLVDDYSGAQTISQNLSPLIAIPTTAGTGSEVTEAIVVFDEVTQTKLSFVDSHLSPTLAVLDPILTCGLPPKITAATGLDALTHAIEAMMSIQRGPVSDALALKAIALISQNIVRAVQDGNDLEARGALLVAATMAGMAFNHAMVGVVHAVAHTVGALFHVHHGTANAVFLPFGMEYNFEVRQKELAAMLVSLGKNSEGDIRRDALASIEAVKELLRALQKICKFPTSLQELKIPYDRLNEIAEKAPDDGASFYNPRQIHAADLLEYLKRSFESNQSSD